MDVWQRVEGAVERAVRHFKAVDGIASPDDYTGEMAIRHALQCGDREMREAISRLEDLTQTARRSACSRMTSGERTIA
jgi:hypothetical protein